MKFLNTTGFYGYKEVLFTDIFIFGTVIDRFDKVKIKTIWRLAGSGNKLKQETNILPPEKKQSLKNAPMN